MGSSKCYFSIGSAAGFLPAKPAFLVCDGSTTDNNNNRQQQQTTQICAQNVTFQKSPHFSKFSESATPHSEIDESSKSLRYVTLLDRHPDGVLEMLLFNRLGGGKFSENATPLSKIDESSKLLRYVTFLDRHPDGGPRNVTFQSARRRQNFRKCNSSQ